MGQLFEQHAIVNAGNAEHKQFLSPPCEFAKIEVPGSDMRWRIGRLSVGVRILVGMARSKPQMSLSVSPTNNYLVVYGAYHQVGRYQVPGT